MEVSKKIIFIKDWILSYVNSMPSKAQSLVIGISGGIDSSVSSTLSAMTGLRTIVLTMPIKQKKSQHDLSINSFNKCAKGLIPPKMFKQWPRAIDSLQTSPSIGEDLIPPIETRK